MKEGLIPPFAEDVEEAVLGAIITIDGAYETIVDLFKPELFYKHDHFEIAKSVENLYASGKKIDMLTLSDNLKGAGQLDHVGGEVKIAELAMKISSDANIETHIRVLTDKYILRELIATTQMVHKECHSGRDVAEVLDEAQSKILSISEIGNTTQIRSVHEVMTSYRKRLNDKNESTVEVETHLEVCGKWKGGQMILLGARPSMGKSALMLDIGEKQAMNGIPVGIFSLEMKDHEKVSRLWQKHLGFDSHQLSQKGMNKDIDKAIGKLSEQYAKIPLYFDCPSRLTISEFQAKARRLVKNFGVKVIFLDYLQLLVGDLKLIKNESQYIGDISRKIKQIAMELDIVIVALSQLNRSIESRPKVDQIPRLSDLRASGSLEQDADTVFFLADLGRIGLDKWEYRGEYIDATNKAIIDSPKRRNGKVGAKIVNHTEDYLGWSDYKTGDMPF